MMTSKQTVKAFTDAIAIKDYETALSYVAPDCEYENIPLGKATGPEGVRATLEPFFAPTLENEFQVLREVENGALYIGERLDRHRLETGWVELPVTGVWEVHGGKITLWRDYFDAATLLTKWPTAAEASAQ